MALVKYDLAWVGIDGGREGLWKDPLWKDVLEIISKHVGERVYDAESPIYRDLEERYPNEAWRSYTSDGHFRPLFRDYPNSWKKTGVLDLQNQIFEITKVGRDLLDGKTEKAEIFLKLFHSHSETISSDKVEKPFCIIAAGLLCVQRPLSTKEIYWGVMKNYRPGQDDLGLFLSKKMKFFQNAPEKTPYRRLRNMLSLMRASGSIISTKRGSDTYWASLNKKQLCALAEGVDRDN